MVQSVNKKGLKGTQKLLKDFDINAKFYAYERKRKNHSKNYLLVIAKKEERYKYLINIGFNHPLKQQKLSNLVAGVAQPGRALESK